MIDFTTLQGLTIPEGVVTQITDDSGRVIWAVANDKPIVLEVEKITSDTYAGETTYTGESFILLDIYPKTASSTVKVTYGGLTKTLAFSGTNAQQVFFGTFNGVSDNTPASGELTIEGGCVAFGCGSYSKSSKNFGFYCSCITGVIEWGDVKRIPNNAFYYCSKVNITEIPDGVTSIGENAFYMDFSGGTILTAMTAITLPATIESIAYRAFNSNSTYGPVVNKATFLATKPPILGEQVFGDNHQIVIVVPKGCGEVYKLAEGWSTLAQFIVEAS